MKNGGQITLWYVDLIAGTKKRFGRHGHKIDRVQNDTYPVIAWHPKGRILTYTLEEKGSNFLVNVDLTSLESERKELFQIDKVLSMAYAPDGMTMIWSAMRNGQSDLYRYQVLSNNQRALWSDPFDDLDPVISADWKYHLVCIKPTEHRLDTLPSVGTAHRPYTRSLCPGLGR